MGELHLLIYPSGLDLPVLLLETFFTCFVIFSFSSFLISLNIKFLFSFFCSFCCFWVILGEKGSSADVRLPCSNRCSYHPISFIISYLDFLIFHFSCSQSLSWNFSFEDHTLFKPNSLPLQHLSTAGHPLGLKLPCLSPHGIALSGFFYVSV